MSKSEKMIAASVGALGTGTEIAWTTFLVLASSKIPYIGIPLAALIGIAGAGCTAFIASRSYIAFKNLS